MSPRPDVFNAGYCLESVWRLREKLSGIAGFAVDEALKVLSTFHLEFHPPLNPPPTCAGGPNLQIPAILLDLLRRGLPTFPTVFIEEALTKPLTETGLAVRDSHTFDGPQSVTFSICPAPYASNWLRLLARSMVAVDPSLKPEELSQHHWGSFGELRFFEGGLANPANDLPWQLFEPQRPLVEMVKTTVTQNFTAQRVDFALATPSIKLALEYDGPHHVGAQHTHDRKRDRALDKNGWKPYRVPFDDLGTSVAVIEHLQELLSADPYCAMAQENIAAPVWDEPLGELAVCTVLTPIAIARIQHTVLLCMLNGQLDMEAPEWKIVVSERDVPCAELALVDLHKQCDALAGLMGLSFTLPAIDLTIIYDGPLSQSAPHVCAADLDEARIWVHSLSRAKTQDDASPHADLFIDISILRRQGATHATVTLLERFLDARNGCAYTISSAFDAHDYRQVSCNPAVLYATQTASFELRDTNTRVRGHARTFLQHIFRKPDFRPGQYEIVRRALAQQPVIGLLPTGAGKSVCYQLSALLQPGMSIVIDPIISLVQDQVENLRENYAVDWCTQISSMQDASEKSRARQLMSEGRCKFLFVTPERLQTRAFRDCLAQFTSEYPIPYAVIDEAHCVSEWGHDFRTSYLRMASTIREKCRHDGQQPTFLALTGTASTAVLTDVQRELDITDEAAIVRPDTFKRAELHFYVVACPARQKAKAIEELMRRKLPKSLHLAASEEPAVHFKPAGERTIAGIVFSPHVNGKYGVHQVAAALQEQLSLVVGRFAGAMESSSKKEAQTLFKHNEIPLLVATKAFGMGVDKPNIRYTIHYNVPQSMEAFYQEAGRAGRDRQDAVCWLLFSDDDATELDCALRDDATTSQIRGTHGEGDGHRMLYLHNNSYRGSELECQSIVEVRSATSSLREQLDSTDEMAIVFVPFPGMDLGAGESSKEQERHNSNERGRIDKAIYRLSLLGIVQDYTVDYGRSVFEVAVTSPSDDELLANLTRYLSRYKSREAVSRYIQPTAADEGKSAFEFCVARLIEFVYAEIELKRRAALLNMIQMARQAAKRPEQEQSAFIALELSNYLDESQFAQSLAVFGNNETPTAWLPILDLKDVTGAPLLASVAGARQLLGAARRALESSPEHIGYRFCSSVARFLLGEAEIGPTLDEAGAIFRRMNALGHESAIPVVVAAYSGLMAADPAWPTIGSGLAERALSVAPSRRLARDLYSINRSSTQRIIYSAVLADISAVNTYLLS